MWSGVVAVDLNVRGRSAVSACEVLVPSLCTFTFRLIKHACTECKQTRTECSRSATVFNSCNVTLSYTTRVAGGDSLRSLMLPSAGCRVPGADYTSAGVAYCCVILRLLCSLHIPNLVDKCHHFYIKTSSKGKVTRTGC